MHTTLAQIDTVLITGASSGIGAAFARQLANRGKNLILVARREEALQALAAELSARHGAKIHVIAADLARPAAAAALFAETERRGLAVDLLINNAGFGKLGPFGELPFDVQADMVRVNVNSLLELSWLYLTGMRQRRRGGIINVASTAAFQPVPYLAVYAATKAFVLKLSEALAEEVAAEGITVLGLCPGDTATGFQAIAGTRVGQWGRTTTADEVVSAALCAFDRGQSSFVHGFLNRAAAFVSSRLLPRRFVARMAGRWGGYGL